jgi:membrane peptidoglycan carboxypeptidase
MTVRARRILAGATVAVGVLAALVVLTVARGFWLADDLVARMMLSGDVLRPQQIPQARIDALLRVEDPRFFDHCGVDLRSPGAGLTTITQGLVKRLYFERFRPGFAKIPQTLYALGFDLRIDKPTQLALFLNLVPFGNLEGREILGFPAAARSFYGKQPGELSEDEFLSLVAMIIAPNALNPIRHPEKNHERVARIRRLLAHECAPAGLRDVYYDQCGDR